MDRETARLLTSLAQSRGLPCTRLPRSLNVEASDGVRLHMLDWPGTGETLILLHGGALSAHSFDLACLGVPRARCIAVDLRGHGESGWSDHYSIERSVQDLVEIIEALGLARVHLAGMSLGGCVAAHAAPVLGNQLASLTLIDVAAEVNFAVTAGMRRFLASVQPVARVEDLVSHALQLSPKTDPHLMLYRYRTLLRWSPSGFVLKADRRRPTDFAHILGKLSEIADIAPRIQTSVLVVRGARSAVLSCASLDAFVARFPNARWVEAPGAGHNVQEDNPAFLASALHDQLRQ